jgi:hypothetical protein
MTWALWLAAPVAATALAALWAWWRARGSSADKKLDTVEAMRAHRDYLDALTLPARAQQRCASGMEAEAESEVDVGAPRSAG